MHSVVIDTSVWADYFRRPGSAEGEEVSRLLVSGSGVMVGVVYAELLRGARDDEQVSFLEEVLDAVPFVEVTKRTWNRAGRILAELQRRGSVIPMADAVIAGVALEHGLSVFTRDGHFQRVPGLALHQAGS